MRMTIQLLPQPHNAACCARGRVAPGGDAFALMRVANALSVYAILLYQTWRKSSFGRLSVGEPRSSHTPSTNARRAMCATSARDGAPSATIFAESWDLEVLARTVSSQSYSAISWTWILRCSPLDANSTTATAVSLGADVFGSRLRFDKALPLGAPIPNPKRETAVFASISTKKEVGCHHADIHSGARMGMDMTLCSRRAWITATRLPTSPHPKLLRRAALAVSD